jgi:hypothetical protein
MTAHADRGSEFKTQHVLERNHNIDFGLVFWQKQIRKDSFLAQKPSYGAAFAYCPVRWGTDFAPYSIILVFEYGTVFPWCGGDVLRASPPVLIFFFQTKIYVWKRQNVLHRAFPQVQSLDMDQNLAQSATFWTSFLPKPSFGRSFGRVHFMHNEPICTHFRQVVNRERCSILKASRTRQRMLGTPLSTPYTCLLLPHSPFVNLSPAFRRLPPRPRQHLPCMAGVTTDAATGAGSAGKGLGWNQAELLAVARAAPDVLQSPINGTNKDTSTLLDIRPLENPLLWASHPNHALG